MNLQKEYEKLEKEFGQIPHQHCCELKMVYGNNTKLCPYSKKQLKDEGEEQCDNCDHSIYVVFSDIECTKILFIQRLTEEWFKKHPEERLKFETKE